MIGDSSARADGLHQTSLTHNFEMPRCCGLIQPEFIREFGYIERFLAEGIEHEDAVWVREGEAKICFEFGYFLFESWINHVVLAYIRMNVYLHPHHNFVIDCTIVNCVILSFV